MTNINKIPHPQGLSLMGAHENTGHITMPVVWGYYYQVHVAYLKKNNKQDESKNIKKIPYPQGLILMDCAFRYKLINHALGMRMLKLHTLDTILVQVENLQNFVKKFSKSHRLYGTNTRCVCTCLNAFFFFWIYMVIWIFCEKKKKIFDVSSACDSHVERVKASSYLWC